MRPLHAGGRAQIATGERLDVICVDDNTKMVFVSYKVGTTVKMRWVLQDHVEAL